MLTNYLGDTLWHRIDDAWRPRNCRDLAALARQIETISAETVHAAEDAAAAACRALGLPAPIREAVRLLVGRAHLPWENQLHNIAYSIRMIGVLKCVSVGLAADECACLKDLSVGIAKKEFMTVLAEVVRDVEERPQSKQRKNTSAA
jgi:hypothetical protein